MEVVTEIKYIAQDGQVFERKQSCVDHELRIKNGGIFLHGSIITEKRLYSYLWKGYWLANYKPGRLTIFAPPPGNGGYGEIYGPIADKLGKIYDEYNYGVYQRRAMEENDGI